jgi:hypothetical protein
MIAVFWQVQKMFQPWHSGCMVCTAREFAVFFVAAFCNGQITI